MSIRAMVGGLLAAVVSFALLFVLLPRPELDAGLSGQRRADLEGRIGDLERKLDQRLDAVERQLAAVAAGRSPSSSDRSDAEPTDALDESDDLTARVAALEARLETVDIRQQAQEDDPVLRGYAYLTSASWRIREQGIGLLRELARFDPEARDAIRKLLDDPESEIREKALDALEHIEDRESMPRMAEMTVDAANGVREQAVESLAEVLHEKGSPEDIAASTDTFLDRLGDDDRDVREAAAEALGSLKIHDAVPALVKALEDPEKQVREAALDSLAMLQDPAAIPYLRALYAEGSGEEPLSIASVLKELGDPEPFKQEAARLATLATSAADARTRREAIKALGTYGGGDYRSVFDQALKDRSLIVRQEAERALKALKE